MVAVRVGLQNVSHPLDAQRAQASRSRRETRGPRGIDEDRGAAVLDHPDVADVGVLALRNPAALKDRQSRQNRLGRFLRRSRWF